MRNAGGCNAMWHIKVQEWKLFIGARAKIEKEAETDEERNSIDHTIMGIEKYLALEDEEFETNQLMIEWKCVFRGYVMRMEIGNQSDRNECRRINRVITKECTKEYTKHCIRWWHERNQTSHDPAIKWAHVLE